MPTKSANMEFVIGPLPATTVDGRVIAGLVLNVAINRTNKQAKLDVNITV